MIEANDIESLKNLYKFVKKTSHQKILAKHYETYIETKINEDILSKVSEEESKLAKSKKYLILEETVTTLID